jgi:hypothetical protein
VYCLKNYDPLQAILPSRPIVDAIDIIGCNDPERRADIARFCEMEPNALSEVQINHLINFLNALTDFDSFIA